MLYAFTFNCIDSSLRDVNLEGDDGSIKLKERQSPMRIEF